MRRIPSYVFSGLAALFASGAAGAGESFFPPRTVTRFRPYLEWRVENPTWSGNPFDLRAVALFRHAESGETRRTELFFDGKNAWRFRFTGTRRGRWTFRTESEDPDFDGKKGTVIV